LVEGGSVRLWHGGGWSLVGRSAATVLRPGEVHEGVADPGTGLAYIAVTVPVDLVSSTLATAPPQPVAGLLHPAQPIRQLVAAVRVSHPEERRERTVAALSSIFNPARSGITHRAQESLAVAVKRHLDASFAEPVQVGSMAGRMAVAPATLIRSFRQYYGLSPYAYVVSRRVDLARHLLDAGVSPAEVAGRAGFYDQPHLNRHFTRLVGVPPGAYRRG
jgi:AraC-like DNA-binding protein